MTKKERILEPGKVYRIPALSYLDFCGDEFLFLGADEKGRGQFTINSVIPSTVITITPGNVRQINEDLIFIWKERDVRIETYSSLEDEYSLLNYRVDKLREAA